MTIREILKKYSKIESDLLLAHVFKKPKEFLYANPNLKVAGAQKKRFTELAKKRQQGKPAAYVLGYKYFFGLKFKVNKDVLIPRPETEWIVEKALSIINHSRKTNFSVADIGTGSGCIAISIAKFSYAQVTGIDISSRALKVAKANAVANKVNVKFLQRDLMKNLNPKFDLIIANLPYVPAKDYKKFYQNLKYEPKLALVDNESDSNLYRKIISQLPARLNRNGCVLLEIDPSQCKELKKLLRETFPNRNITSVKDLNKLERFIWVN